MQTKIFSWRSAGFSWLVSIGIGVAIAAILSITSRLPMSEGSDSVLQLMNGIFSTLLLWASTYPLAKTLGVPISHALPLVVPNVALLGLLPSVVVGFVYDRRGPRKLKDARPLFKMYDGED